MEKQLAPGKAPGVGACIRPPKCSTAPKDSRHPQRQLIRAADALRGELDRHPEEHGLRVPAHDVLATPDQRCMLVRMVILAGTMRIGAGKREAALAPIMDMVKATRGEPGCIEYSFAFDVLDDHLLHVFEVFVDDAAVAAHRASAHMARWRVLMPEVGIGGREMSEYQVASSHRI